MEAEDVAVYGGSGEVCRHVNRGFSEKHDAVFCRDCGEWISSKCMSSTCPFCKDRPKKAKIRKKREAK